MPKIPLKSRIVKPGQPSGDECPWVKRKVRVEWDQSSFTVGEFLAYGEFIVYDRSAPPAAELGWGLWHLPTQLPIVDVKTEEDAKKIAETLWGACCVLLKGNDMTVIRDKAPKWVKPWIHLCRKTGAWVSPAQTQKTNPG